ncbi:unnamed protein product [Parajaminaea phylloscopi]
MTRLVRAIVLAGCVAAAMGPSPAAAYTAINPYNDNIFLHLTAEQGHAIIISLIYFSFWLGALGWEIISTLPFDLRVLRETNWASLFSIANSLAYYISRYGTFAWILRCLLDGITASDNCSRSFSISASLYGVCVCGTYFVFLLRTVNIWKMQAKAVVPLGCIMATMIGLCAALPWNLTVLAKPGDPFCAYQVGGKLSYVVLATCACFDAVNFTLLALKLSKPGFRGLLRCLLPQTKGNYDQEEVSMMLLQRTGVFCVMQFGLLISLAILYASTHYLNFQLMQVAAFHAVSAGMAGRIFRKAWKLTREQSPTAIAQPPSYSPDWLVASASAAGAPAGLTVTSMPNGMGGVGNTPVPKSKEHLLLDDDVSYVEGELQWASSSPAAAGSSKEKAKSVISMALRTAGRTAGVSAAQSHCSDRQSRASTETPPSDGDPDEIAIDMTSVSGHASPKSPHLGPCPLDVSLPVGQRGTNSLSSKKSRAKTSHGPARRPDSQHARPRPSTSHDYISPPVQIISPGADAGSSTVFMTKYVDGRFATTDTASGVAQPSTSRVGGPKSSLGPGRTTRRPHSSGSGVSCVGFGERRQGQEGRPPFVASPPMTAIGSTLPVSPGEVIDLAIARAAAASIPTAHSQPPALGVVVDDPLEAFRSAVTADEAIAPSDDDGRPRTSRGGPPASFGAREPRRFSKVNSHAALLDSARKGGDEDTASMARPRTSHGIPTTAATSGSLRFRSREASTSRSAASTGYTFSSNPTSEDDPGHVPDSRPCSRRFEAAGHSVLGLPPTPSPAEQDEGMAADYSLDPPRGDEPIPSAIDEAYRRLEEMAALSRTTTNSSCD